MATYQELMARSQQVRDEQNIGGNTALRVGQLLMDIVKYFNDNDAAASEYLQQHFAMVNDGTHLLNWQQSPIVILHTMGETYDEGDFSSLSQGENYYRNGFVMEANGQGGGINGETPKANVLYVNLANDTLYTWNGASFDAITSGGGGGSILNVKDNNVYNVWVGTQEELDALGGNYEDNTIYLVGTVPAIAQKFNVNFNGGSHTSIPANTPQTVKEGSAFSVIVSPASGYTIDTATGTMVGGTLTKTNNQDGTVTFSTSAVIGAITITAAATKHITGITVSAETRTNNSIPLSAVVAPPGAENVTLAWSVDDTTNFGISGSGTSATLTIKSGASNSSVTITCADTNAASGTKSGTLQLTGLSYVDVPTPITEITDITATRTAANTLTLEATADGNTPITFSIVGTAPKSKKLDYNNSPATLEEVDSVVLSGDTLSYKEDCKVTIQASAENGTVTFQKEITIEHNNADAIWFEDEVTLAALNTNGVGSNGAVTYAQAAAVTALKSLSGNTDIVRFNEFKWFTGITKIGTRNSDNANFDGCTSLEAIEMPSSITVWAQYAFRGTALTSVIFDTSASVQVIDYAISGALSLTEVIVKKLSSIVVNFSYDNKTVLQKLKLGRASSYTLPNAIFTDMTGLKELDLGEGISALPYRCCRGCTKLEKVTLRYAGKVSLSAGQAFYGISSGHIALYVPSANVSDYPSPPSGYDAAIGSINAITE